MSTNRLKGALRQAKGGVKEAAGRVTGNRTLQVKGMADKAAGTIQNKIGKLQERLGGALRR